MTEPRVIFENLPCKIKGFCVRSWDGDAYYTIVLNARLSHAQHLETYKHELEHILNEDFDCDDTADSV